MASADDKRKLIVLARRGHLEGDDGFRVKLTELNKAGIVGPGHDYGLDYSDKPFYRSALWEATWKNHEAICRLLVEKGATIDFADYQMRTPLHEAAYMGHQNLVEFFLEKGHPIDPKDTHGQTPLFRAVEAGRDQIVQLLVERKADVNRLDGDNVTIQHLAAFNGMPNMSQWLLYKGSWKNRFSVQEEAEKPKDGDGKPSAGDGGAAKTMITETEPATENPADAPAPNSGGPRKSAEPRSTFSD